MYKVLDICGYVINYSNKMNFGISNLKLQKILYFIQAVFLINRDKPCFTEEIEAWDFGPVVPEAYHEFKRYGSLDIPTVTSYYEQSDNWNFERTTYNDKDIADGDKELINEVINKFSGYAATDLVNITHQQMPWLDAYVPHMNNIITKESIKEYFSA